MAQWLEGAYQSSDNTVELKLTAAARSCAETCERIRLAIENIKVVEKPEDEPDEQ